MTSSAAPARGGGATQVLRGIRARIRQALALVFPLIGLLWATPMRAQCPGDMNGDHMITVDEILAAVDSALNGCPTATLSTAVAAPAVSCPGDLDGNHIVDVTEILTMIAAALHGCPLPASPTPSSTVSDSPTGSPTLTPTPSPTFTPTPSPPPSPTPSLSPAPTLNACPYTFSDDTLSAGTSCGYSGPFNLAATCPNDLQALFLSDGSSVAVAISTNPVITFIAAVTSPTAATLSDYTIGTNPTLNPVSGSIELQQNGALLVIAPTEAPFSLVDQQCTFDKYIGSLVQLVTGPSAAGRTDGAPKSPPRLILPTRQQLTRAPFEGEAAAMTRAPQALRSLARALI